MFNYIKADLARIFRRVPRIVLTLISFAVFCLAIFIYISVVKLMSDPMLGEIPFAFMQIENPVFTAITTIAGYAVGLFGLFELIFVFSDDLRAKTAQIAIGVGVSRVKVVFSKFFELLVLLVVDMAIMFGLSLLMSGITGSWLSSAQMIELLKMLAAGMLISNIAYACLVFILMFATQSMTLGILSFLALNFHVISGAFNLTSYVKFLANLNLNNYTLTAMIGKIKAMAEGAAINPVPFLAVAAYMVVGLVVTCMIYRKKELEF